MKKIKNYSQLFFKFYFPNFDALRKRRFIYGSRPFVDQYFICSGKGTLEIGFDCKFGYKLGGFNRGGSIELQPRYKNSSIFLGDKVATNNNIFICAANYIAIGDNTRLGQNVIIMDHEAHSVDPTKRNKIGEIGSVIIGKNVWVGNNVQILKNSAIGDNSIVAAGAVVTGKFPSNVILGGVPAKILRNIL